MKVAEFIRQYDISRPTFYRKIADAGIKIGECRDAEGELTELGLARLVEFMSSLKKPSNDTLQQTLSDDVTDGDKGNELVSTLSLKLEDATRRLEDANKEIDRLHREVERVTNELSQERKKWDEYIRNEQVIKGQLLLKEQNDAEAVRQAEERMSKLTDQLSEIIKKQQELQEQRLLIDSKSGGFLRRLFGRK